MCRKSASYIPVQPYPGDHWEAARENVLCLSWGISEALVFLKGLTQDPSPPVHTGSVLPAWSPLSQLYFREGTMLSSGLLEGTWA